MDYKKKIKQIFESASKEAQLLLQATMEIEREYRWKPENNIVTGDINKKLKNKVNEVVK